MYIFTKPYDFSITPMVDTFVGNIGYNDGRTHMPPSILKISIDYVRWLNLKSKLWRFVFDKFARNNTLTFKDLWWFRPIVYYAKNILTLFKYKLKRVWASENTNCTINHPIYVKSSIEHCWKEPKINSSKRLRFVVAYVRIQKPYR